MEAHIWKIIEIGEWVGDVTRVQCQIQQTKEYMMLLNIQEDINTDQLRKENK